MYAKIAAHPTVRELWADSWSRAARSTADAAEVMFSRHFTVLEEALDVAQAGAATSSSRSRSRRRPAPRVR